VQMFKSGFVIWSNDSESEFLRFLTSVLMMLNSNKKYSILKQK